MSDPGSGTIMPRDPPELISPHLKAVQGHYRDTAEDYRQWSPEGNLHFGYWRWGINPLSRKRMLEELNLQVFHHLKLTDLSDGDIVDLGCGVGAVSRCGAARFPTLNWQALNVSPQQIANAQKMTSSANIRFHCHDYHTLPWEDESISGAFFVESLCYSLAPDKVIAEVARVLKPGARIVITDGYLMRPLKDCSSWFQRLFKSVAHNWAVPAYHELANVKAWSSRAGLRLLANHNLSWRIAPCVLHSVPLTLGCAAKLWWKGTDPEESKWRWRQLAASAQSLLLGLHQWNFRYYLNVLEKPA